MARILLGVTGGIAAYKACELTRLLVQAGHEVIPLVTRGADRFVRRETFAALARRPAKEDLYPHLTRADLLVIAPLTANTMAKLAYGLADDVLTEAALAHRGPVLVAPAMNPRMWAHPATQANAATLRERDVELIGPDEGETAEGELGVGRMSEPQEIFERVQELLGARNGTLAGKRVLVSAGGTREPLDAVRFVGNRSSGRMGVALANEARRRGAEVTLIASNLAIPAPPGVEVVEAPTAADVERAREKLTEKRVDLIVYNDVTREDVGFDASDNEVVILSTQGERRVDKAPKEAIAAAILDEVERLV
jgi:phosphopantothenoylcysteine decarboxylase/phosphopantothenate--cysteine ligase